MSGCPYEVAAVRKDEVRVVPMLGGMMKHLKIKALAGLMSENRITVKYTPPRLSADASKSLRSSLTSSQLDKLNRQLRWVYALYRHIPENPCSQRAIKAVSEQIQAELGESSSPAASTLAGWVTQWVRGGRSDEALMPKVRATRVDHRAIAPKVLSIVDASIESVYLTRQKNSISAVYADIEIAIANFNATATEPLKMPSLETVRRIVNRIDGYERDLKRHGKHYARRRHHAAGASTVASEPLEICQADGQIMDIIVVEPERSDGQPQQPIGRPYLTVVIDVRTRCVLAAFVSLAPFSGGTLLKTMAIAVVASPGRPRGIMSKLVIDNGSDYQDSGFMRFCASIDITLEPCPPRTPNGKAIVERFFRTITEGLVHKLPGTTFSNPVDRGDYSSQTLARLTLDELDKHVQTWIDNVYHLTPHRGLGRAPLAVWNDEVSQ